MLSSVLHSDKSFINRKRQKQYTLMEIGTGLVYIINLSYTFMLFWEKSPENYNELSKVLLSFDILTLEEGIGDRTYISHVRLVIRSEVS